MAEIFSIGTHVIRYRLILFLLAAIIPACAVAQDTPQNRAARLFAAAREATGGAAWDKIRSVHLSGATVIDGVSVESESWTELSTGRFSSLISDGPAAGRLGFDGKILWAAELDGAAHPATGALKSSLAADTYWMSFGWLRQIRPPLTASWVREEKQGGRLYDIVQVTTSGDPVDLWFDQKNHLPARISSERDSAHLLVRLTQWHAATAGVTVPMYWDIVGGKDPHVIRTIANVSVNGASDANHFAMPSEPAVDYKFPGEAVTAETPMTVVNGHIFVAARSGKTRLLMELATASHTMLDKAAAERLGLAPQPGAGDDGTQTVRIPDFRIAGILFRHTVMKIADLSPLDAVEGIKIDGIIGSDFAKRLIVDLDYQGHRVVLLKPDGFVPPPDATPLDLALEDGIPLVSGRLDGIPVKFLLDTGGPISATTSADFATAHQLDQHWKLVSVATGSDGNHVNIGKLARAGSLELGVLGLPQPLIAVNTASHIGDAGLGSDVLRRFDIILDYPARKLYLQPNSAQTQPYSNDHSGLWINQTSDGLTIANVQTGSPGERATLLAGDRLETISGDKASDVGLSDIRQRLMGPPGSAVGIGVRRNGEVRNVRLVLSDPLVMSWEKDARR